MLSKYSFLHRSTALFLSLVMLLGLLPAPVRAEAAEDDRDLVIVSMGDSYSSGEGIEPFYHQKPYDMDQEYTPTEDWLAHRSKLAWGGQLSLYGIKMSTHRYDPLDLFTSFREPHWFFVASSGAESKHIADERQKKEYSLRVKNSLDDSNSRQTYHSQWGSQYLPLQISVFDTIDSLGLKADYVTLTLGGNDVGFTEIIKKALLENDFVNFNGKKTLLDTLLKRVEHFPDMYAPSIRQAYKSILDHAGEQAHLIVAGYPHIFSTNKDGLSTGILFSSPNRSRVNWAIDRFNQYLADLITELNLYYEYKGRISFVDVEPGFRFHGAYSENPYINRLDFLAEYQDLLSGVSAYSMHPNAKGAKVYAACVQEEIDRLETERLANAQSETVQPEDEQDTEIEFIVGITSDIILNYDIPILYAGTGRKVHSYYEIYNGNEMDIDVSGEPLAGLILYWDEDMNDGRGAPTLSYVASETSVLVSFSCAPYSTSAIFDTTTNLWNELPENLSWSFGVNYFIGQSLSTDIHSTSYSTFIYDICGNPFLEMHNMEYGQIIEYMGKPCFIYGDATSYSRVDDPYDPESTFSYDIYGIDLETGNITPVCSYTMYCSLWNFYLIQLTKDGLCIYDMDLQQTAVYDFTGGTINER